jgi:tRNA U34 5-methylaminomethyl-2-thiouridine-forming methyltransferase MnmC
MEQWDEYYHSMHGAYNEAMHVYIESGLSFWKSLNKTNDKTCTVFEMGFGTGLNALLSLEYATENEFEVEFETIEAFPLSFLEVQDLDFDSLFPSKDYQSILKRLHLSPWEKKNKINPFFSLLKNKILMENFNPVSKYDVIYYDAFGFRVQPQMWSEETLGPIINALNRNGVFVTYSAKGCVRRSLEALGLEVFRIEGPPGKREMLRAIRA